MKKVILLIQILIFSCAFVACSSVEDNVIDGEDEAPKAVNINLKTAGSMDAYLADNKLKGVESLVLTGEMNVLDFIALKKVIGLKVLDISDVKIMEYNGIAPIKYSTLRNEYPANTITLGFMCDESSDPEVVIDQYFPDLNSIKLPKNLERIEVAAFIGCKSLKSIIIPNTVHSIMGFAFAGCESLETVELPANYTGGLFVTFDGCKKLRSINIPVGISSISRAFLGCNSLSKIELPLGLNSSAYYYEAFIGAGLKEIAFPEDVTRIGNSMFAGCPYLENVVFHENIAYLEEYAFTNCPKIKSIKFVAPIEGFHITSLDVGPQLEELHLKNTTPMFSSDILSDYEYTFRSYKNCTLYVPVGSKANYESNPSNFWKLFKAIVEE